MQARPASSACAGGRGSRRWRSEEDAIAATAGLTKDRLITFIAEEIIRLLHGEAGPVYRHIDLARLRLLCELSDDLDLDMHALGMATSLIDQQHDARIPLRTLSRELSDAPDELRSHVDMFMARIGT